MFPFGCVDGERDSGLARNSAYLFDTLRLKRRFDAHEAIKAAVSRNQAPHRGCRHPASDEAIGRLVGALLLEHSGEWPVQRARYMTLETMVRMKDDPQISLPALAR
jgi:hypothetical protein